MLCLLSVSQKTQSLKKSCLWDNPNPNTLFVYFCHSSALTCSLYSWGCVIFLCFWWSTGSSSFLLLTNKMVGKWMSESHIYYKCRNMGKINFRNIYVRTYRFWINGFKALYEGHNSFPLIQGQFCVKRSTLYQKNIFGIEIYFWKFFTTHSFHCSYLDCYTISLI